MCVGEDGLCFPVNTVVLDPYIVTSRMPRVVCVGNRSERRLVYTCYSYC